MTRTIIRVDGPEAVGEARRKAVSLATELGMDEATAARAAIVVTECASNVWKHAGGGEILLSPMESEGPAGVEIVALDKGPGMNDVARCFQDGYSTAGSAGTGLGAVQRLSSQYDIHTERGKGTALVARVWKGNRVIPSTPSQHVEVGAVAVPLRGEIVCGDGYAVHQEADFASIIVVDGLGHGPAAAACADAAKAAFLEAAREEPAGILDALNGALRALRGAAAVAARFDPRRREIRYCGIGNIAGLVYSKKDSRHMVSQPGIVGHNNRNVREFTYDWPVGSIVLLYSDGITTHWSLGDYDELLLHDPALMAAVLYRDLARGRDDATMLVARDRFSDE
jgi:anti-sigma regulatory factor (Ser/Thr protein kinase)